MLERQHKVYILIEADTYSKPENDEKFARENIARGVALSLDSRAKVFHLGPRRAADYQRYEDLAWPWPVNEDEWKVTDVTYGSEDPTEPPAGVVSW